MSFSELDEFEARVKEIKLRRCEIVATLAEWKRQWFVDGIQHPFNDRLTLEAEEAALAFESLSIQEKAKQEKAARAFRIKNSELNHLIAILEERGLGELVSEARKRSEASE